MTYVDKISEQLADILDAAPEKVRVEAITFVREQLVESYKNGIAAGRRTQKDGLRSPRPQFASSKRS